MVKARQMKLSGIDYVNATSLIVLLRKKRV